MDKEAHIHPGAEGPDGDGSILSCVPDLLIALLQIKVSLLFCSEKREVARLPEHVYDRIARYHTSRYVPIQNDRPSNISNADSMLTVQRLWL